MSYQLINQVQFEIEEMCSSHSRVQCQVGIAIPGSRSFFSIPNSGIACTKILEFLRLKNVAVKQTSSRI